MAKTDLTAQRLREVLHYDPETGVFTWRVQPSSQVKVGDVAGGPGDQGYARITVDGFNRSAHRLAWLYMHGEFPKNQIDHADGVRNNNRLSNLRESSQSENCQNRAMRSDNTSGFIGVNRKKGKWRAQIMVEGKNTTVGYFDDPAAAYVARLAAQATLFKFQPVPRDHLSQ